jgi:hypothetical protein
MTDEHDSTANGNDLINYGATEGYAGQIYKSYRFDGVDDYMNFPHIIEAEKPLTMELWVNILGNNAENSQWQGLFCPLDEERIHITFHRTPHEEVPAMSLYTMYKDGSGANYLDAGENSGSYGTINSVASRIDVQGTAQIFLNGVGKEIISGIGSIINSDRKNVIGAFAENSGVVSGFSNSYIDEVRFSHIARSDDWLLTQYNNQNNPSMFYIIGPEETGV